MIDNRFVLLVIAFFIAMALYVFVHLDIDLFQ